MSLLDFFRKKEVTKTKGPKMIELFTNFFSAISVENNSKFYTGWVATAIRAIAEPVADIKLKLLKQERDGSTKQIFDHEILKLLSDVNPHMTFFDVMERCASNIELQGNEYWFLAYGNSKVPQKLFPLIPEYVRVVADAKDYVSHYEYTAGGKIEVLPRANVIQFKTFNPSSDILGIGTLEAVKGDVLNDLYASEYNQKFFKNSGRPDVILEYADTLTSEAEKRLLSQWTQRYSGAGNNFKTVVASGGLKVNSFQMSQKDMDFLDARKFNRDSILAMFRVPPSMIGMSESTSYAAAKAVHYAFMKNVITPKMRRIVNVLNEFLIPLFDNTGALYFDFESPAKEDRDLIIKEYQVGIASGWLSINDVRRKEELPEIEGGDVVNVPFGLQPLGAPKEIAKNISPQEDFKLEIKMLANNLASGLVKSFTDKKEDPNPTENAFDIKGEQRIKKKDNLGLAYKKEFDTKLKTLWSGQKKRATKNLDQFLKNKSWGQGIKAKVPEILDSEFEVKTTIDLMTPLFEAMAIAQGKESLEFLGLSLDEGVLMNDVTAFVLKNTKKFAGEVTQTTTDMLRAQIASGLEQGEPILELTKRIQDSAAFNNARSEKIARTETVRAQSEAELEVWKESGVVSAKVWYTALDERTCENCGPMHQVEIGLEDSFFKMGDSAPGGLALNYSNVDAPTLHPNCRCTLLPIVK